MDRPAEDRETDRCLMCGAVVRLLPAGCRNPCPNCRCPYPLGDCED